MSKLLICLDDDSLPASWLRCGVLVTADSRVQWWMHLRSDCLLCVKPSCNFLSLQCHFLLHCVLARALSFVTLPPPAHQPCLYVRLFMWNVSPPPPPSSLSSASFCVIVCVGWRGLVSGGLGEGQGEAEGAGWGSVRGAEGCHYPRGSMGALCQYPQWDSEERGRAASSTLS